MADENRKSDAQATDAAMRDANDEVNEASVATDLDQLQVQLDEARERHLRLQADWENYRKRARRDLEEERKYANQYLLTDLLPVLDNVQRAIDAATKSGESGGLADGVKMVAQQLDNVLAQHHCKRIDAQGKPFDPNLHEAVAQQPVADQSPGTVVQVYRDGYQFQDRVIRPAQVVVSTAPPEG
jgi:molecular chaperone GrpE